MQTIGLVTSNSAGNVVRRIQEEAKVRGINIEVIPIDATDDQIARLSAKIIIARIAPEVNEKGITLLRQLESRGVRVINDSDSWAASRNKRITAQQFVAAQVPQPLTLDVDTFEICHEKLGTPFVMKSLSGTHGKEVYLVTDSIEFDEVVKTHGNKNLIAQQFLAEAGGSDIRLIVVGDAVVAAMKRQGAPGEFRSNIHLGGSGSAYQPTAEEVKVALTAAKALGLEIAGIDLIPSHDEPRVLEANPSPGLGIETMTGQNVAGRFVEYASSLS